MNDQTNGSENRTLLISTGANLVIGVVGLTVYAFSSSQAILLDGLFNLTYFAMGLFTLKVAKLVQQGDDERFPMGYAFFEPLVNGVKGTLVLGVSIVALVGAVQALWSGGRAIAAGQAVTYGIFASTACCSLAVITHRIAKRTGSPLVTADAENWIVNAAISSAVLLGFVGIFVIKETGFAFLAPYIDPSLVLVVVLISISMPVRMAWQALMELLNRTPSPTILQQSYDIVARCTERLPVQNLFVRVIQPGRTRMVLAHVVLPADFQVDGLQKLDVVQEKTRRELQKAHAATSLDIVFTADPAWGAPSGTSAGR
jgi:cation diffusion facilitator family transporter